MQTKVFYFNPYRECTYVIWDDASHAVIIDAGMYEDKEKQRFSEFIQREKIKPVALLITHAHPDHVCGQEWIETTYNLKAIVFPAEGVIEIPNFSEQIEVIRTPGHKEDCVCYHLPKQGILFSGDTLFQESIGRTDLPGGDLQQLLASLHRLMKLPLHTQVLPGHGYPTTIVHETENNPFI